MRERTREALALRRSAGFQTGLPCARVAACRPRAALKSVWAIPNPGPEDRRPRSELIATPAEQPPIELGHARNSDLPPITQMGADNKAGRQAGRLRHGLFPICAYLRHLRLRNSDFGLLSGFGLRSSDFRAAEHDLPSTGRTLEPPCPSVGAARASCAPDP